MLSIKSSRYVFSSRGRGGIFVTRRIVVFCVCCSLVSPIRLQAQESKEQPPVPEGLSHVSREATSRLISMTQSAAALRENFGDLLDATLNDGMRYDDTALGEEMIRRFDARGWPQDDPYSPEAWAGRLPSDQLQALCWLAECNKRLLVGQPEMRAQQRAAILKRIQEGLAQASDTDELCGFLDVAYRTIFYFSPVTPRDGADEIIDLYKKYVGHDDPTVHDFACGRLRNMGFVWRSRYDEILAFLIANAPELKVALTAKPLPGMDILIGTIHGGGRVDEVQWCALDTMPPADLGAIVDEKLTSWRSQYADGNKALSRLLRESQQEYGEPSFQVVKGLLGKGIRTQEILYTVATATTQEHPPQLAGTLQRRFDELVVEFQEVAASGWPRGADSTPEEELQRVLEGVQEASKKKESTPVLQHVEAKLSGAIEASKAGTKN